MPYERIGGGIYTYNMHAILISVMFFVRRRYNPEVVEQRKLVALVTVSVQ